MTSWFVALVCAIVIVVVEVDRSSAAAVVQELAVTAGRQTPLAWPPCLTDSRRRRTAGGKFQYAVVVDAGSSSTWVHVYRWPTLVGKAHVALQAPGVEQIHREKITPGLSRTPDPQRFTDNIHVLLTASAKHVPRQLQRSTPVYLMATGGQSVQCFNCQFNCLAPVWS